MDLGIIAQAVRRVGAVAEPRAGAERLALSVRLLLPTLQQAGSGSTSELARDIRAAVAGRDSVTLVLPTAQAQGAVPARLEAGARQFALPAVLRDALLAAAASPGAMSAAANAAPAGAAAALASTPAGAADAVARAWAVAAQTTAAAAQVIGGSGAPRAVHRQRDDAPPPATRFTQPLFEPVAEVHPAAAIAGRLRTHIERSGLFFEAHVAQWVGGERDAAEMRAEALRMVPQQSGEAAQRVAAQVAVLQEGGFVVHGPAWPGQALALAIEREPHSHADAMPGDDAPVFVARMAMDLPQLGRIELRLRLAGAAVSMRVSAADPQRFADAFAALGEQFAAQGLVPVQLQAVAADAAEGAG